MELFFWLFLAFVLLLGPMILAHEVGHFLAARRAGVRILEFGIGFPPRLLTLWREKGTLSVEGVPLRLPGRVRLPAGLQPGAPVEVLTRPDPQGFPEVVRVQRVADAAGDTPSTPLLQTEETNEGTLWRGRLTSLEPGTVYSLNWLPLGGFVRMLGEEDPSDPRSLAAQPKRWRLAVLVAGALANVLAAFLLFTLTYSTGVPTRNLVLIQEVVPGTPAEMAGLLPGDVVVEVNGMRLEEGTADLRAAVYDSPLRPLTLTVLRGGQTLTLTATPALTNGHGFLGVVMQPWPDPTSLKRYPLHEAAWLAGANMGGVILSVFQIPRMASRGEISGEELRPAGLPGILSFLALALKRSVETGIPAYAFQMAALISMAIGLTNLLPLPALDGGRALFVLLEAIRGRRLRPETEMKIHMAGMAVLVLLSLFLIVQDILNPFIPWSWLK